MEFSDKQKELQKEKEIFHSLQKQRQELIGELRDIQGKTVHVSEIAMQTYHIERCQENESLQKKRVTQANKDVHTKREALIEATQKRKVMETLKSKQFEEFQSHAALIEQTTNDEMVIMRYNREKQK